MERSLFKMSDGKEVSVAAWSKVANPKAIVQIVHGMAEHMDRYDHFAQFLNENGYIAFGNDHRGHGLTDPQALGKVASKNDFSRMAQDTLEITQHLKSLDLPIILFGHSYGSFLSQKILAEHSDYYAGIILMGSAYQHGAQLAMGKMICAMMETFGKRDKRGKIPAKLTFGSYEKIYNDGRNSWLSRDKEHVAKYNKDRACGFMCSYGFYHSFFRGLSQIVKIKHTNVSPDYKLMVMSGASDLVGGNGKLVTGLVERYKKLGFKPELKLYEGARHELLNESNNAEVYADMLAFFNSCISI